VQLWVVFEVGKRNAPRVCLLKQHLRIMLVHRKWRRATAGGRPWLMPSGLGCMLDAAGSWGTKDLTDRVRRTRASRRADPYERVACQPAKKAAASHPRHGETHGSGLFGSGRYFLLETMGEAG
jgi:hypothetical protein